jgi:phospholipid/cholesterol/gamma-HCH transport system substrate-binding protein
MTPGSQVRVGAVVVGALVLLGLAIYFVLGLGASRGRYHIKVVFPEANLQRGDEVRMVGVVVGSVDDVNLTPDQRAAEVTLSIDRTVRIRENYSIRAASAVALEKHWVEIVPVTPGGRTIKPDSKTPIEGTRAPEVRDVVEQAEEALAQLGETAKNVNRILGDPRMLDSLLSTFDQLGTITQQFEDLANALVGVQQRIEPRLADAMQSARRAANEIASTAKAARQTITGLRLDQMQSKVAQSLDTLNKAGEKLDLALQDVRKIAAQPGFAEDVHAAVRKTGEAMDSLKAAGDSLQQAGQTFKEAGKLTERISRLGSLKRPQATGALSIEYLPHTHDAWVEGNLSLDLGNRTVRLGLADVGGGDRFNLQIGKRSGRSLLRAGLIQSELGVGYDVVLGRKLSLSGELFDTHDIRLNLLGYYSVGEGYDLVVGGRDLGRDSHLSLGVRATR